MTGRATTTRPRRERPRLGAWGSAAACLGLDPTTWYPSIDAGRHDRQYDPYATGRAICADCPVLGDCLAHALAADETHGMWGGLDPDERARLKNRLHKTQPDLFSVRHTPRIQTIQVKGTAL